MATLFQVVLLEFWEIDINVPGFHTAQPTV